MPPSRPVSWYKLHLILNAKNLMWKNCGNVFLCLVPTTAMTFIVLSNKIWSTQIHHPKFVARAFPSLALIQFWTHHLLQKGFIKKSSFYIILNKMPEYKTERNLNEVKLGIKPSFKKKTNKGVFHQMLKNINVSDREAHFRYMITQT